MKIERRSSSNAADSLRAIYERPHTSSTTTSIRAVFRAISPGSVKSYIDTFSESISPRTKIRRSLTSFDSESVALPPRVTNTMASPTMSPYDESTQASMFEHGNSVSPLAARSIARSPESRSRQDSVVATPLREEEEIPSDFGEALSEKPHSGLVLDLPAARAEANGETGYGSTSPARRSSLSLGEADGDELSEAANDPEANDTEANDPEEMKITSTIQKEVLVDDAPPVVPASTVEISELPEPEEEEISRAAISVAEPDGKESLVDGEPPVAPLSAKGLAYGSSTTTSAFKSTSKGLANSPAKPQYTPGRRVSSRLTQPTAASSARKETKSMLESPPPPKSVNRPARLSSHLTAPTAASSARHEAALKLSTSFSPTKEEPAPKPTKPEAAPRLNRTVSVRTQRPAESSSRFLAPTAASAGRQDTKDHAAIAHQLPAPAPASRKSSVVLHRDRAGYSNAAITITASRKPAATSNTRASSVHNYTSGTSIAAIAKRSRVASSSSTASAGGESFLARMTRPTAATSGRIHEKGEVKVPLSQSVASTNGPRRGSALGRTDFVKGRLRASVNDVGGTGGFKRPVVPSKLGDAGAGGRTSAVNGTAAGGNSRSGAVNGSGNGNRKKKEDEAIATPPTKMTNGVGHVGEAGFKGKTGTNGEASSNGPRGMETPNLDGGVIR